LEELLICGQGASKQGAEHDANSERQPADYWFELAGELELMLLTIMEIRAHPILLPAMPRRAIGVISSRMRWEGHFSMSSISLADLGGQRRPVLCGMECS
jgi:hypothetical protein